MCLIVLAKLGCEQLAKNRDRRGSRHSDSDPTWLRTAPKNVDEHFHVIAPARGEHDSRDVQTGRYLLRDLVRNSLDVVDVQIH